MLIEIRYHCTETYHGEAGQSQLIAQMILAHEDPNACLPWPFKIRHGGYGVVRHNGEDWRVHRLAFKTVHGRIPRDKIVMHSCDNPPCFNPNHLSLGSRTDNAADRHAKGRTKPPTNPWRGPRDPRPDITGEKNKAAKLTADQVREIRRRYASGSEPQTKIALEYGVNQTLVSAIVTRRTWKHVVD